MEKLNFLGVMFVSLFVSACMLSACSDDDNNNNGDGNVEDKTYTVNGVQFTMIAVEGGTFQMGSENGEDEEKPVHSVTLSDYYIGQMEVTQALYTAVMDSTPSQFKGDDLPVENISWNECQEFITKLNDFTGKTFRLPTEAEWEFAAKGGTKSKGYIYSGSDNIDDVAWYGDNSESKMHPVGTKMPNELGIYDMTGNVHEWCYDWYNSYSSEAQTNPTGPTSSYHRVLRGGSWLIDATNSRVTCRFHLTPRTGAVGMGFRLAK